MTGPLLLGVRHHGPGSARAVRAALDAAVPPAVLIEGPPEGDALLALAADEQMRPPVALLAHAVDDPGRAAFWPLAEFSPEWVAIRWALERGVPVRFIDLPAAHSLALAAEEEAAAAGLPAAEAPGLHAGAGPRRDRAPGGADAGAADPEWDAVPGPGAPGSESGGALPVAGRAPAGADLGAADPEWDAVPRGATHGTGPRAGHGPVTAAEPADGPPAGGGEPGPPDERGLRIDPIAVLAGTAGYDDPERWWEDVVEHRGTGDDSGDPRAAFLALGEAMAALRETYGHGGHERDLAREAHMRLQLRAARREFGDSVAVVCGAWHLPALEERTTVAADKALLKGLPKVKTEMTWVPWTYRRLGRHSGYGAGIDSPGWYGHLFGAPDRPIERWMTKVAGLLRDEDRLVSSAHVIEAVRLAETLAAMRGRPLAGLTETTDAVRAVMCEGSDVPLDLVRDRLIVGDVLGEVPAAAPAVPLQRDLTRLQRGLRLKPEALERELELDLRKETDAAKSRLLHRLRLLSIGWGEPVTGRGSTGTFRESWRLRWEPELFVKVAEAGVWGTTVLSAATAKAESNAVSTTALADVTALAEQCLLAELPDALPVVMRALADRAALDADVGHLAQALPALARSLRYGDVRSTDTAALGEVAAGLAERICVGLPPACTGLDADGAAEMRGHLDGVHTAIGLLPKAPELSGRWGSVLHRLAVRDTVPGVIRGRAARLLLDDGRLEEDEAARLMGLALSVGTPPAEAAAWIEGFVGGASGGGMLLVHDERLLSLVDAWLTGVPADAFTDVLPLLRRTFSAYEPGVRRTLGELVRRGPASAAGSAHAESTAPGFGAGLDGPRADAVLPVLHLLLGTGVPGPGVPGTDVPGIDDNDLVGMAR
ncbi:DUF5682 family protein [Streptomyces lunaelactis]|uniref:DUF5682 family protein n=1 Tax=Streptomyces lunaelactis TaxID=1535768 RepID=UPI0020C7B42B|nr:DUF5682 family protein [Streptomyces lunaelactis]